MQLLIWSELYEEMSKAKEWTQFLSIWATKSRKAIEEHIYEKLS